MPSPRQTGSDAENVRELGGRCLGSKMFLGLYHQPLGKLDGFVSLCQSCIEAIFRHDAPEKGSSNLCHGRDTLIYWIQIRHSISSTTSLPTALGVVQPTSDRAS